MVFALALVVSAVAALNIALPDIARETGASETQLQWIIDGYAVVFAGLLLPAGSVGDRFGRRRMLVAGLLIFGAAYGAAAMVTDPGILIAFRAFAGIGAALVMPATLSIITSAFPAEERARAVGVWAGVAGSGAMIGLLLSGILMEFASWRWLFAVNAMWALGAVVVAAAWAPESNAPDSAAVDPIGAVLSAGGLSAAVFATIEGPHRGWSDGLVVGGYVVGVIALLGFLVWESRRSLPLLDPRLFRQRSFANGSLSITLQFFVFFGFVFVVQQYLQLVLDYSPLAAALALLPAAMVIGVLSGRVAPRLMEHVPGARVGTAGLAIAAVGCVALATLDAHSSYWSVLVGIVILGAGMGLATTPATTAIVSALAAEKQGVASAVNDTSRELGGAVGIAVFGSLLNGGYHHGIDPHLSNLPPDVRVHARDSLAFVTHAAGGLGPGGQTLLHVARSSFVDGMRTSMWAGAGVFAVATVVTLLHRERPQPTAPDPPEPT